MMEPGNEHTGDDMQQLRRDYYTSPDFTRMIEALGHYMETVAERLSGELYPTVRLREKDGSFNASAIIEACLQKLEHDIAQSAKIEWSEFVQEYLRLRQDATSTQIRMDEAALDAVNVIGRRVEAAGVEMRQSELRPNRTKGEGYNTKMAIAIALLYCMKLIGG